MAIPSNVLARLDVVHIVNDLMSILCRSLPAYLADADPWGPSDDRFRTALANVAADQHRYAGLLSQAVVEHGGRPDPGPFPVSFTAKNDLSLTFLCREVVEHLERDVQAIQRCVDDLEGNAPLRAVAEEILGNAKGHLEVLQKIVD